MKRFILFVLFLAVSSAGALLFSQSRTVINTGSMERSVIPTDSSNNNISIWEQLEMERVAAEKKAEEERIAAEKAEQERIAAEKAEQERIAAEKKAEQERIAAEKAEQKRIAAEKKAEEERIAAEKKAEEERIAAEKKAEQEQIAAEKKAEQQRIAAEKKAERERIALRKAEQRKVEDSIAAIKYAEIKAARMVRLDSIRLDRKERISSYPWTNMILFNGAYALYPEYAFGITYARVKQGGFYISAMMNPSVRFNADYEANNLGMINGEKPFYSGKKASTRLSATIGALVRMRAPIYFYVGAGYGYRGLFYETSAGEWAAWHTPNTVYHGMHWETGLMGNIKGFGISLGVSSITNFSNIYWEGKLGLGYCF